MERIQKGRAIFCLHDVNPRWFQGYYFVSSSSSSSLSSSSSSSSLSSNPPLGLLAIQEEIDKCLECTNGGYRRLTMNIFSTNSTTNDNNNNNSNNKSNSTIIQGIDWTGGDMVNLTNPKLQMETHRLLTGKETIPFLKKYFRKLLETIYQQCNSNSIISDAVENDNDKHHHHHHHHHHHQAKDTSTMLWDDEATILDLLPNVAIVMGPMSVVLSKTNDDQKQQRMNRVVRDYGDGDDDDDDDDDELWKDEE